MRNVESFAQNSGVLTVNAATLLLERSNSQQNNNKHSNRADDFTVRDSIRDAFDEMPAYPSYKRKEYQSDDIQDSFSSDRVCFDPFRKFLTSDFAICHFKSVNFRSLKSY